MNARASDFYIKEKIAGPERYAHTRHREMEELRKENNRLFGRLLSIYEVSRQRHIQSIYESYLTVCNIFFMSVNRKNLPVSEIINLAVCQ